MAAHLSGTPYDNGVFRMKLILSSDFPHSPPKGYFLTKIFHPNIANNGEICVNTLKKDWNPTLGLRHVLLVIRCLLIEPFPESALNEQAGKMLLENYEEYARLARLYTGIHAKPKSKPKQGLISESTTALNIDQRNNSSSQNADQKNAVASTKAQDQAVASALPLNENGAVSSSTAPAAATPSLAQKKDGASKAQTEKKKVDARKKSLKRL
ncbi:Ubiquitin-conjugating enzyme E2 22 [Bienertia sinuspersici]